MHRSCSDNDLSVGMIYRKENPLLGLWFAFAVRVIATDRAPGGLQSPPAPFVPPEEDASFDSNF